jgi:cystathionine beta-lyase
MMKDYDFDKIICRTDTDSLKHDCAAPRGLPEGLLPLWVADMDFKTADPVIAALKKAVDFGVFGYTVPGTAYYDAVRSWWRTRFDYEFEAHSVVVTPGVVFSLAQAVLAFTKPGDAILIQRPVYYPFTEVIKDNNRKLVNSQLTLGEDGRYHMDFGDFERKLAAERPKMFILCSPHNPVGRVWTRDELERVGDLCLSYGCLVLSDEIHADFTYGGNKHTVFSTIKDDFRANSMICTSPSKTFNLAGLQISNIIIEDNALRRKYKAEINVSGYSQPNIMGVTACRAAYEEGGPWLAALIEYLAGNIDLLRNDFPSSPIYSNSADGGSARGSGSVDSDSARGSNSADGSSAHSGSRERNIISPQGIHLIEPEGSYLPWLDFRSTGLTHKEADDLLINKAKVWLDSGTMFGPEGEGFQRINVACPRSVLRDAIDRIAKAIL